MQICVNGNCDIMLANNSDVMMDKKRKEIIGLIQGASCKSTESKIAYRITFRNMTENDASVYWVNFQGKAVFYGFIKRTMASGKGLDIDTYITHPWIAVDRKKNELLAINFSRILRPISAQDFLEEERKIERLRINPKPQNLDDTNNDMSSSANRHLDAFITESVLTLEVSCCLKICKEIGKDGITALEIPQSIKDILTSVYDCWLL
ncbi:uncharacterized protein LOC135696799 [Rhopilema esculentum]|uniref:uncharacterized protein LOC135696799 n=1 Tax=Rhopilema esculentum TaxID=499914 RepID=UPI0031DF0C41